MGEEGAKSSAPLCLCTTTIRAFVCLFSFFRSVFLSFWCRPKIDKSYKSCSGGCYFTPSRLSRPKSYTWCNDECNRYMYDFWTNIKRTHSKLAAMQTLEMWKVLIRIRNVRSHNRIKSNSPDRLAIHSIRLVPAAGSRCALWMEMEMMMMMMALSSLTRKTCLMTLDKRFSTRIYIVLHVYPVQIYSF